MFGWFGKRETKSTSTFSEVEALLLGGRQTAAGVAVSMTGQLGSVADSCIKIMSETTGQVPVALFRRLPDGGREKVVDHPAAKVLKAPNPWTTGTELKSLIGDHLARAGNFYGWVSKNDLGDVEEIIPLACGTVTVTVDSVTMAPTYRVTAANGTQREYGRDEILHVRGPGHRLYEGASPVELGREAIALSRTLELHCAGLFGSGAKPSGFLKVAGKKDGKILDKIRSLFEGFYRGTDNSGKTMILDSDMSFEQIQLNSVDSQTLEMRRFQTEEVSRYWRIPPGMLQSYERVTHSNAEAMALQFVQFTMLPVFKNISDAMALTLLRPDERDEYFFDWVIDDFVRADLATRMAAYATAISHSVLSPDEARALENRGAIPDGSGKIFTRPVNVSVVSDQPVNATVGGGNV